MRLVSLIALEGFLALVLCFPSMSTPTTANSERKQRSTPIAERASPPLVSSADLARSVRLPPATNVNHWLSTHTVDFFQLTTVLYGALSDVCTRTSCPCMNCGSSFEYLWKDSVRFLRATRVSAPEYVHFLSNWVEVQIHNDQLFPSDNDTPYPDDFLKIVKWTIISVVIVLAFLWIFIW